LPPHELGGKMHPRNIISPWLEKKGLWLSFLAFHIHIIGHLEECKIGTWQENGIIFGPTKYLEK
jgi:hypothetical protein